MNNIKINNDNVLVYLKDIGYCFTFKNYNILEDMLYIGELLVCGEDERYIFCEELIKYYDRFYSLTDNEIEYISESWKLENSHVDTTYNIYNNTFEKGPIDEFREHLRVNKERALQKYRDNVFEEKKHKLAM